MLKMKGANNDELTEGMVVKIDVLGMLVGHEIE